jgi:hypothetical protein
LPEFCFAFISFYSHGNFEQKELRFSLKPVIRASQTSKTPIGLKNPQLDATME